MLPPPALRVPGRDQAASLHRTFHRRCCKDRDPVLAWQVYGDISFAIPVEISYCEECPLPHLEVAGYPGLECSIAAVQVGQCTNCDVQLAAPCEITDHVGASGCIRQSYGCELISTVTVEDLPIHRNIGAPIAVDVGDGERPTACVRNRYRCRGEIKGALFGHTSKVPRGPPRRSITPLPVRSASTPVSAGVLAPKAKELLPSFRKTVPGMFAPP